MKTIMLKHMTGTYGKQGQRKPVYGEIDSEANYVNMTNPRRYDDDMYAEAIDPEQRTTAFQETEGTYSAPRGPRAPTPPESRYSVLDRKPEGRKIQPATGRYSALDRRPSGREIQQTPKANQ